MTTWRIHIDDEWFDTTVKREPAPEMPLLVQSYHLSGRRPDAEGIEASCVAGKGSYIERFPTPQDVPPLVRLELRNTDGEPIPTHAGDHVVAEYGDWSVEYVLTEGCPDRGQA